MNRRSFLSSLLAAAATVVARAYAPAAGKIESPLDATPEVWTSGDSQTSVWEIRWTDKVYVDWRHPRPPPVRSDVERLFSVVDL